MMVLGIQGSPRRGGNSDTLLAACLQGAKEAGARIETVRPAALKISGCLACGACEQSGECAVEDDMQKIYPLLDGAERIVVASPVFFYSFPAQLKALIDRTQSRWSRRLLPEKFPPGRKSAWGISSPWGRRAAGTSSRAPSSPPAISTRRWGWNTAAG